MKRRVLVTGGTKGLGFATALRFARGGSDLILSFRRDGEAAKRAQIEIQKLNVKCDLIQVNLSEPQGVDILFNDVEKRAGGIEALVYNAAATAFKPLMDLAPHHMDKTLQMTVKGFILAAQAAVRMMPSGGHIVSVSGMDTLKVVPGHGLLAAAKSALEQLTTYLAHELGPRGIRVNGVNPGFLKTDSTRIMLGDQFEKISRAHDHGMPLGRSADLNEIAEVIYFLCAPESSWILGQTLVVDGGFDKTLPWSLSPTKT